MEVFELNQSDRLRIQGHVFINIGEGMRSCKDGKFEKFNSDLSVSVPPFSFILCSLYSVNRRDQSWKLLLIFFVVVKESALFSFHGAKQAVRRSAFKQPLPRQLLPVEETRSKSVYV